MFVDRRVRKGSRCNHEWTIQRYRQHWVQNTKQTIPYHVYMHDIF